MINRVLNKFNQLFFKFNPKINKNILTKKLVRFMEDTTFVMIN